MAIYKYPCLPWKNYNTRVGKFLDPVYYAQLGSEHPGQDINGNGGGDTDLNDNIYCITDGIVEQVGYYPSWGNIVLVYHPGPGVWSQYAHLNKVYVRVGQTLSAGTVLGTLGKGANNKFLAHLHFEIRYKRLPAYEWPSSKLPNRKEAQQFIRNHYVDPIKFLQKMNAQVK